MSNYYIQGVNGPVVTVKGGKGLAMMDMVSVGPEGLIGEVVSVEGDLTTVQVYEDTTGLMPGMPVEPRNAPMSIELGPGLLNNIYDGICRPLRGIAEETGAFIGRGRPGQREKVGRHRHGEARGPSGAGIGLRRVRRDPGDPAPLHPASRSEGHGGVGGSRRGLHRGGCARHGADRRRRRA